MKAIENTIYYNVHGIGVASGLKKSKIVMSFPDAADYLENWICRYLEYHKDADTTDFWIEKVVIQRFRCC